MEATNPKLENNHISIRFIRFPFPFSSVERPNEHWAENIRYMSHPEVLGSPSSILKTPQPEESLSLEEKYFQELGDGRPKDD